MSTIVKCKACGKPLVLAAIIGIAAAQYNHACAHADLGDINFDLAKTANFFTGTSATSSLSSGNSFIVEGYDDVVEYVGFYRAEQPDRGAQGTLPTVPPKRTT